MLRRGPAAPRGRHGHPRGAGSPRGTERAALARAEGQRAALGEPRAIADAGVERRGEAEHAHEMPQQAKAERVEVGRGGGLERRERVPKQIVALRMRIRRCEAEHHLRERFGRGIARQIGGQADVQVHQVESREEVQLPVLLREILRLTLAQELERAAESALGTKGSLGDGALHPVLAGGEAHDLRRLAVAQGREHDRRRGDEGHSRKIPPPARRLTRAGSGSPPSPRGTHRAERRRSRPATRPSRGRCPACRRSTGPTRSHRPDSCCRWRRSSCPTRT